MNALESASLGYHRSALARLKSMRQRPRDIERAGEFLIGARSNSRRSQWTKARMHWFSLVGSVSEVKKKLLDRQDASYSRSLSTRNHIAAVSYMTA